MLLYHGTSDKYLPRILADGLAPRNVTKTKGNFAHTLQSASDRVYLTDAYAPYFADIAASEHGGDPVVLGIDTDRISNLLVADEDALEQVNRLQIKAGRIAKKDMIARTKRFRKDAPWFQMTGNFTYEQSLALLGTCACVGTIDPKAIVGYFKFKRGNSWQVWDPTITLMNYRIMQNFYRYATEVAWKGKADDTQLSEFDKLRWRAQKPDEIINELVTERAVLNQQPEQETPYADSRIHA